MKKYDDILWMPHPVSSTRKHMTAHDRAAQFAPFAALTGFGDVVEETGRITAQRPEVAEDLLEMMDRVLETAYRTGDAMVEIEYFKADARKSGGEILRSVGRIAGIRKDEGCIIMEDGTWISMADVTGLRSHDTA